MQRARDRAANLLVALAADAETLQSTTGDSAFAEGEVLFDRAIRDARQMLGVLNAEASSDATSSEPERSPS